MSKMAEMAQTIEELRTAAASINAAADWLYQQFSGDDNEVQATEAPTKKEPKPELKLEDVRAVLAEKSRAGHTAEVRALLKKYGAAKLSEIDPKLRSPDEGRGGDRQWQLKHTQSCPRPAPTGGCTARRRQGSAKPMRTKDQTTLQKAPTLMRLASTN